MSYGAENGEELILLRLVPKAGRSRIVDPVIGNNQELLDAISARPATQPSSAERAASFRLFTQSVLKPFSGSGFTLRSGCGVGGGEGDAGGH